MDALLVYFWSGWFTPEVIEEMGDAWREMWYNKAKKATERETTLYVFEIPNIWLQTPERVIDAIMGIERFLQERYPDHVLKVKKMIDEQE